MAPDSYRKPAGLGQARVPRNLGAIFPWIPRFILLASAAYFGVLFLLGGIHRVKAWYRAPLVLPLFAAVIFLSAAGCALIRRRLNRNILLTGFVCLLFLPLAILPRLGLAYPASIASTRPSAAVRLPARVALKVMWGGDTYAVNYHVVAYNERWAYDFVVPPYFTGSSKLEDYGCYGIPVIAPAAGTVVAAHDGEPDMLPGTLSNNQSAPAGNHIAIRLAETGTYLEIAHLKPGSLQVIKGQPVEEGQVIARCGNSGNTSEPHIHIHHQREDPNLAPPGLAEGLPLYFRDQDGPPMPEGGNRMVDGKLIWTGAVVQSNDDH